MVHLQTSKKEDNSTAVGDSKTGVFYSEGRIEKQTLESEELNEGVVFNEGSNDPEVKQSNDESNSGGGGKCEDTILNGKEGTGDNIDDSDSNQESEKEDEEAKTEEVLQKKDSTSALQQPGNIFFTRKMLYPKFYSTLQSQKIIFLTF